MYYLYISSHIALKGVEISHLTVRAAIPMKLFNFKQTKNRSLGTDIPRLVVVFQTLTILDVSSGGVQLEKKIETLWAHILEPH